MKLIPINSHISRSIHSAPGNIVASESTSGFFLSGKRIRPGKIRIINFSALQILNIDFFKTQLFGKGDHFFIFLGA